MQVSNGYNTKSDESSKRPQSTQVANDPLS